MSREDGIYRALRSVLFLSSIEDEWRMTAILDPLLNKEFEMKRFSKSLKALTVSVASLMGCLAVVNTSSAGVGLISKGDLQGTWQISLVGYTGCGSHSMLVTHNTQQCRHR